MPINNGNNAFAWFINRFKRQCNDDIDQFCCLTNRQLNIIEYDDDEIDKQPQPTTFLESIIYPSENMIYKNQGKNAQVKVQSSKMDDDGVLRFQVEFPNGTTESTTCEHLHRPEQPEVANIPVSTQDYQEAASTLTDEELKSLANPKHLSPQEQEFLDVHHRLFHLLYVHMFPLAKIGVLPKPCVLCLFGQAHRKPHGALNHLKMARNRFCVALKSKSLVNV